MNLGDRTLFERLLTTLHRIWFRWADVLVLVKQKPSSAGTSLLPMALPAARWQAEDQRGSPRSDPTPSVVKASLDAVFVLLLHFVHSNAAPQRKVLWDRRSVR
jgi:hypothetical protein